MLCSSDMLLLLLLLQAHKSWVLVVAWAPDGS
jgi:hypothetical protein